MDSFKVINVIDSRTAVISCGSNQGIKENSKFLIYKEGAEIIDPDTNENYGKLEILVGRATVKHLQDNKATIVCSDKEVKVITRSIRRPSNPLMCSQEEEIREPQVIEKDFDNIDTKCFARVIK